MFGKKESAIEPKIANDDVLIQVSESIIITKKTKITVPTQYKAIAYIDQKALYADMSLRIVIPSQSIILF